MPGTGIPDFEQHAQRIAAAGIYDFSVHHDQILVPVVLRQWKVAELTGLNAEAEAAVRSPHQLPRAHRQGVGTGRRST